MDASTVVIQVQYGNILRRFNTQIVDLSLAGVTEKIFSLFKFPPDTKMRLTFTVGDGDSFAVVDDDTLCDVVKQSLKPLRITVELNAGGTSTPTPSRSAFKNPNAGVFEIPKTMPQKYLACCTKNQQKYRDPKDQPGLSRLDSCLVVYLGPGTRLNTLIAPSTPFTYVWSIRNTGTVAWPQKTQLVWIGGPKLSNLLSFDLEIPATGFPVGQELKVVVDLISPEIPGWFTSYWRMVTPSGQKFGQLVWVITTVGELLKSSASSQIYRCPQVKSGISKLDGCVIRDWNINKPDCLEISPSTPFTKIWRVGNNGTVVWPQKTRLVWIEGEKLSNLLSVEVEIPATGLAVGQELDVAMDFISPRLPRQYISYWRLTSPSGQMFGQRLCVLLRVGQV